MKPAKLIVEYDYHFDVLGIVSTVKEYKLAWHINNSLSIQLKKQEDLVYEFSKGRQLISNYTFETDYNCLFLLKNRAGEFYDVPSPFLLPELKEYDYFMLVQGEETRINDETKNSIKVLPCVDYVNIFEAGNLKSKENLIF